MPAIHWKQNTGSKMWEPSDYPSDIKSSDYNLPSGIQQTFQQLNSQIENKYAKEYIKMCAFYNKMFPSLKSWDWSRSSHNSLAYSAHEQERYDGSTGIVENFLKNAIDTLTARISNIKFDASLFSDSPSLVYEIYKQPIEQHLKRLIKNNKLVRAVTEVFHDAAILGYGHLFVDPWSGAIRKISDWELGCYEVEFCEGTLKRALIRDFAFPVTQLAPYVQGMDPKKLKEVIGTKPQVDLKLFVDAVRHEMYVTIEATTLEPQPYQFDEVLLTTFSWDLGIKRTTTTSLFDLLYPVQRAIQKLNGKKTQLIESYKGPVPVFNNDCDVIVKNMGNGAGEALFLAAGRNPAEVITVINPTPLDPEMNAEITSMKQTLQELAGVQEVSLDMENIRSAATVIALDQLHDKRFQSQLMMIGVFVSDTLQMALKLAAAHPDKFSAIPGVPWDAVSDLLEDGYVDIRVVHNPTDEPVNEEPDYGMVVVNRAIVRLLQADIFYVDLIEDFTIDPDLLKVTMAKKLLKLKAMDTEPEYIARLEAALLQAFMEDIATGAVIL